MRKTTVFFSKLLTVLYCFVLLSSCNNDDIIDEQVVTIHPPFQVVKISASKLKSANNENVTDDEYVLQFRDDESYNETLYMLSDMSLEERIEWTDELPDFNSVAQIYDQAMLEAESYYDRPGGYEEFKAKYSVLYFPEEGEDYGAYLPYKNDIEVFCANENGRLMIGDEIVNIEPLTTYEELIEVGRAMIYEEPSGVFDIEEIDSLLNLNEPSLRATLGDKDRIDAFNVTPLNLFQKFYVGGNTWRHTTGWRKDGKRAIKVSLARKFFTARKAVVLSNGFHLEWHLEVAFRKKGFLGAWYNFRNNSNTFVTITYLSDFGFPTSQKQIMRLIDTGSMSSHDMYAPAYVIKHIVHIQDSWNNVYDYYTGLKMYPNCVYELPGYYADISANIGGFSHQRIYFYAPKLWSYTTFFSDKLN